MPAPFPAVNPEELRGLLMKLPMPLSVSVVWWTNSSLFSTRTPSVHTSDTDTISTAAEDGRALIAAAPHDRPTTYGSQSEVLMIAASLARGRYWNGVIPLSGVLGDDGMILADAGCGISVAVVDCAESGTDDVVLGAHTPDAQANLFPPNVVKMSLGDLIPAAGKAPAPASQASSTGIISKARLRDALTALQRRGLVPAPAEEVLVAWTACEPADPEQHQLFTNDAVDGALRDSYYLATNFVPLKMP